MPQLNEPDSKQIAEWLGKISFFENFSSYERKRIATFQSHFIVYNPNTRIIREGDTDTTLFILIRGNVMVEKAGASIIQLGPGEFFGEMAFLTNTIRNTDVVALEHSLVLRMSQQLMKGLSSQIREKIKDQIIFKLVERLNKTTERLRVRM